ncbi:hypothetical protein [Limnofasciculus baicalensis]|uniref:Uncharacterized protein n=1 Tax=Limnofasciculus baicalensis BBK-W-15 TaxID=2699891 RepID=A0AAE3GUM4_9CYAN|nr:hypothetical protein [Limnofasciculus baicalensis]MCP2730281.1 hypothetical protein [Limnofasciculus baicalensis BBK-W-15]
MGNFTPEKPGNFGETGFLLYLGGIAVSSFQWATPVDFILIAIPKQSDRDAYSFGDASPRASLACGTLCQRASG